MHNNETTAVHAKYAKLTLEVLSIRSDVHKSIACPSCDFWCVNSLEAVNKIEMMETLYKTCAAGRKWVAGIEPEV